MEKVWLNTYREYNIREEITPPSPDTSLLDVFETSFKKFANRDAFVSMDKTMTYRDLDTRSRYLAAYLQSLGLKQGARVAVMMPNILQYPVSVVGIIRAGYVLVNVNPLYTARELEHQLKDSGSEVLIILENFAHVYQGIKSPLPVKKVIIASVGDLLGLPKGLIVNMVLRYVKKQIPAYSIDHSISFKRAIVQGASKTYQRPNLTVNDTALLQYTGGTTGVSKGAELTQGNLVSNLLQTDVVFDLVIDRSKDVVTILCALPLYHIFAFSVCLVYGMHQGGKNILIANPRDLPGLVAEIDKHKPHLLPAVNTLFNALVHDHSFKKLDFSNLRLAMGGGMSVLPATAEAWQKLTGVPIIEGYGLSETSPIATVNPPTNKKFTGSIGIPVSSTEIVLLDDDENIVALGERGEISIRGPQVMRGYWQRPDETAKVMTKDGFFKTGDIGVMDENGYFKIVDRKKDMILVSGFNVYPNEIEGVITLHPKVLEAAVIGVPDEKSGEVPKLFVVKKDPSLTEEELRAYCDEQFTGYKKPRYIEFMVELPKSNVGKILRKDLRA